MNLHICKPISVELTYGLERLCMFTQQKKNVFDLVWNNEGILYKDVFLQSEEGILYRDVFLQSEKEFSAYNFEFANVDNLFKIFDMVELETKLLLEKKTAITRLRSMFKGKSCF